MTTAASPASSTASAPATSTGSSYLPVIEFTRALIQSKGKHVRSSAAKYDASHGFIGTIHGDLALTPHRLFHATAKADLLHIRSQEEIEERQEEVAFLCRRLFDWAQQPLRIRAGRAGRYKMRSQLAGSLGEGIALLMMDRMGFPYWDHADTVLRRARGNPIDDWHDEALRHSPVLTPAEFGGEIPDFVCEGGDGRFVIAEAKGGFARPSPPTLPAIKKELSSGLIQIASLAAKFAITPHKSYVVGSYFREVADECDETPVVAFVDPKFEDVRNDGFPDDWIRRGNYAAWLIMMGFPQTAAALRARRETEGRRVVLPVIRIGGTEFALTLHSCGCFGALGQPLDHDDFDRLAPSDLPAEILWFLLTVMSRRKRPVRVVGMHAEVLRRVGSAAIFGPRFSLAQLPAIAPSVRFDEDWFTGSILSDGTLIGDISSNSVQTLRLTYLEFKL